MDTNSNNDNLIQDTDEQEMIFFGQQHARKKAQIQIKKMKIEIEKLEGTIKDLDAEIIKSQNNLKKLRG